MRKIIIPQPWACLMLAGIIDIFDLGVDLGTGPCLVLIQAAPWQKYDNSSKTPLEWLLALEMAQLMGIVPLYHEMPFDCIIGYVIAGKVTEEPQSVWAYGGKKDRLYRLYLPLLFDKPLPNNAVVTEDMLLRSSAMFPTPPHVVGDTLCFNVNKKLFYDAVEGFSFSVPMTDAMFQLVVRNGEIIQYKSVMLSYNGLVKRFIYEKDNDFDIARDGEGKPKHYYCIRKGKDEAKPFFRIHLRHKIY